MRCSPGRPSGSCSKYKVARRLCLLHMKLMALSSIGSTAAMQASFDTNSCPIRIDNCATACISHKIEDFVGPLRPSRCKIQGIGNSMSGLQEGTIQWDIEDDNGIKQTFTIPNSIYAPNACSRLLSPQHVARERKDHKPNPHGTWCATYHDKIVFWWDQEHFKRTIPLDENSAHVGTIYTAPGYSRFNAFCAKCQDEPDKDILAYEAHII